MTRLWSFLCAAVFALAPVLLAAEPAILVADELFVQDGALIASGNVEAFVDDTRLRAEKVIYDQASDTITLVGPIRITEANGDVLMADAAELDQKLETGLLKGARAVLNDQVQITAAEAQRIDGRYVQHSKVAVTSCLICGKRKEPLWQIRAEKVIHDTKEQQLYLDKAQFRILRTPIVTIPKLRLPDPTNTRSRGWLPPSLRSTNLIGFGVELPYFIPFGDHKDLTLTPFLTQNTTTLGWRYRQAFVAGNLTLDGAFSKDTLKPGELRSYVKASGTFDVPADFKLRFTGIWSRDPEYLANYGINGNSRQRNNISATRVKRDSLVMGEAIYWNAVRVSDTDDTQPGFLGEVRAEKIYHPTWASGEFRINGQIHMHDRFKQIATDGADADDIADGRDIRRINTELSWRDSWTLNNGLQAALSTHLWADHTETLQDAASLSNTTYVTPGINVQLRYPLVRQGPRGGQTLIEPLVQYGWVGDAERRNGNDESRTPEFDEASMLALSQFPGQDRRNQGHQYALGLRATHKMPGQWQGSFVLGQVWQDEVDAGFDHSSGLDSLTSDTLIAGQFRHDNGLSLSARGLLAEDLQFTRAEVNAGYLKGAFNLNASYALINRDEDRNIQDTAAEWTLSGSYRFNKHWTVAANTGYDLANDRLDHIAGSLRYQTECVQLGISAWRSYGRTANIEPTTTFDLSLDLLGFGSGKTNEEYHRTCSP